MIEIWRKLYNKLSRRVLEDRNTPSCTPSVIYYSDDTKVNDFLFDLTAQAVDRARREIVDIPNADLQDSIYYNIFPGEHYRTLKAIINIVNPSSVVEIGTFTGMGSVAISQGLKNGSLYTFDILPWNSFDSHLTQKDFDSKRVVQYLGDLSKREVFDKYVHLLDEAQIIFMDAPKDGVFEYKLLSALKNLKPKDGKLLILDDIKLVNMIDLWRNIKSPKLDITSFGHWSGTGLVDISEKLKFDY
jgi:predicted O-methyltransferase YrrM